MLVLPDMIYYASNVHGGTYRPLLDRIPQCYTPQDSTAKLSPDSTGTEEYATHGPSPVLIFADIENTVEWLKSMPMSRRKKCSMLFSPDIPVEMELRLYLKRVGPSPWGVDALCRRLNTPLCPHLRLGDEKVTGYYPGWPEGFHTDLESAYMLGCDRCKTRISFKVSPSIARGNCGEEWCTVHIRRPLGRLFSSAEPSLPEKSLSFEDLCSIWEYSDATDD